MGLDQTTKYHISTLQTLTKFIALHKSIHKMIVVILCISLLLPHNKNNSDNTIHNFQLASAWIRS